jgi:hypothetical protein
MWRSVGTDSYKRQSGVIAYYNIDINIERSEY